MEFGGIFMVFLGLTRAVVARSATAIIAEMGGICRTAQTSGVLPRSAS